MTITHETNHGSPRVLVLRLDHLEQELAAISELSPESRTQIKAFARRHDASSINGKGFIFENGNTLAIFLKGSTRGSLFSYRSAGAHAHALMTTQLIGHAGLTSIHLTSEHAAAVVEGMILSDYTYSKNRTPITLHLPDMDEADQSAVTAAVITANAVNHSRWIAEHPANLMTPEMLAEAARMIAEEHGLAINVLDESGIRENGLGAIAAVSRGSVHPPRLITLEYTHPEAAETVAIVGKGVNFDSGGLSLKNPQSMMLMKFDKTGATAALGAIAAVAELKPKINVVVTLPATENVIGPDAYKPGDVITTYTGLTVEIGSTDAEGRLILGDALAYTIAQFKPTGILSIASLTGAVKIALGRGVSAIAGTSDSLCRELIDAGNQTDERLWQMPIFDVHEELLQTEYADTMNMKEGGEAGLIQGNVYLKNFTGDTPWAAIDIASTAWDYRGAPYIKNKGASGFGTRLLTRWVCNRAEKSRVS